MGSQHSWENKESGLSGQARFGGLHWTGFSYRQQMERHVKEKKYSEEGRRSARERVAAPILSGVVQDLAKASGAATSVTGSISLVWSGQDNAQWYYGGPRRQRWWWPGW